MKILRVCIDAGWSPARTAPWVMHDTAGERVANGTTAAAQWPPHDQLELVVAAAHVRMVSLALPLLAPARLAGAARFAIEDQIAGDNNAHVAVSTQRADGTLSAILCPREMLERLCPPTGALTRLRRVIAEPELAIPQGAWRWCGDAGTGSAFVRMPDGGSFPVSDPVAGGRLPPELELALREHGTETIAGVRVEWLATHDDLVRWQDQTSAPFLPATPWHWDAAPAAAFAAATNLLQGELALEAPATRPRLARTFAPALWLLGGAFVLHVAASVGHWATLKIDAWRQEGAWTTLGLAAGLPREGLNSPTAIRAALARRQADLLHVQHRFARGDALPLMARASVVIAGLPAGSVKRAAYADEHWTLDINVADAAVLLGLESRARQQDLEALVVATPGGARLRVGAP